MSFIPFLLRIKRIQPSSSSNFLITWDLLTKEKPNIVFLQLESFIDASYLLNLEYSADPTPYFRYLKENYPSGYLTVPTFGAGTANTEFEVITGMNIDYFGTGEYPYNTVLIEKRRKLCYN